jgi:hypothetical protein
MPSPRAKPHVDAFSLDLDYLPKLPKHKRVPIGCIGAGFIMADCRLVAYRQAGFNPVASACSIVAIWASRGHQTGRTRWRRSPPAATLGR